MDYQIEYEFKFNDEFSNTLFNQYINDNNFEDDFIVHFQIKTIDVCNNIKNILKYLPNVHIFSQLYTINDKIYKATITNTNWINPVLTDKALYGIF